MILVKLCPQVMHSCYIYKHLTILKWFFIYIFYFLLINDFTNFEYEIYLNRQGLAY